MVQIELSDVETDFLREVLVNKLSELRMEIACTDRREFREYLRTRSGFVEDFVRRLETERAAKEREWIRIDRLRGADILLGLTDYELERIAVFFREEKFAPGVRLCEEGAMADRLYILEEGEVSLSSRKGDRLSISAPGKSVGWSFLVAPNRYTATAVTASLCRLLVMKSPDFYYLIHKEPKMGVKVMDNLAQIVAGRLKQGDSATL